MFENNQWWSEAERARRFPRSQGPRTGEESPNRTGEPSRYQNNFSNGFPSRFNRPELRRFPGLGNEYRGNEYRPRREYQGPRGREGNVDRREFDPKKNVRWEENPDKQFCIAHRSYGHATDACHWLKYQLQTMPAPEATVGAQVEMSGEDAKMKLSRQGNWVAGPPFRQ